MHINPDHYLVTATGRVWTPERNLRAWELAYADFEQVLVHLGAGTQVYVVMGVQAAGKTAWIQAQPKVANRIYFDAALPARKHRVRLLSLAQSYQARLVAVWVQLSLELALQRNRQRASDEIVPEEAVQSVYNQLEAPDFSEGFAEIIWVHDGLESRQVNSRVTATSGI